MLKTHIAILAPEIDLSEYTEVDEENYEESVLYSKSVILSGDIGMENDHSYENDDISCQSGHNSYTSNPSIWVGTNTTGEKYSKYNPDHFNN